MMISALKMIAERIALWRREVHDVERLELHAWLPIERDEHRRDDGEIFCHVVCDRECRQCAACHQQLLADFDDLDQLGRIGIEVDHVASLARRLRAGVHRDADVGLRQRRRVVGAIAAHGDELALGLLVANEAQLFLGRGLCQEIVDTGFRRDSGCGHRIVTGDHDRADAHAAQFGEALADTALDDVLEVNDAEHPAVLGDGERCTARFGDGISDGIKLAHGVGTDAGAQRLDGAAGADRARQRTFRKLRMASTAPLRTHELPISTPLMRVCA